MPFRCQHPFDNPQLPVDKWYGITYVDNMKVISASKARAHLYRLLDEAAESHEPIEITSKRSNAILIDKKDWKAAQETLYLLSIPRMRESIRKGLKTPIEKCSEKLDW